MKNKKNKILGTKERPRVVVFRSNKYIYVQVADDEKRKTIAAFSSRDLKEEEKKDNKTKQAKKTGMYLAKILKEKNLKVVIFDRKRYIYKGRVRALAEGIREGGIKI